MPRSEARTYSEAQKRAAVEAMRNRGDRTVPEIAAEHGVHQSLLYVWAKRIQDGEPLDLRAARSKAQTKTKTKTKAKPTRKRRSDVGSARTAAPPTPEPTSQRVTGDVRFVERDELLRLRAENARLRAMLRAALEGGHE